MFCLKKLSYAERSGSTHGTAGPQAKPQLSQTEVESFCDNVLDNADTLRFIFF
jgi:hypothetical protein